MKSFFNSLCHLLLMPSIYFPAVRMKKLLFSCFLLLFLLGCVVSNASQKRKDAQPLSTTRVTLPPKTTPQQGSRPLVTPSFLPSSTLLSQTTISSSPPTSLSLLPDLITSFVLSNSSEATNFTALIGESITFFEQTTNLGRSVSGESVVTVTYDSDSFLFNEPPLASGESHLNQISYTCKNEGVHVFTSKVESLGVEDNVENNRASITVTCLTGTTTSTTLVTTTSSTTTTKPGSTTTTTTATTTSTLATTTTTTTTSTTSTTLKTFFNFVTDFGGGG